MPNFPTTQSATVKGIIGGGVGGSHLGLLLRQHGVSATIYSAKTPAGQSLTFMREVSTIPIASGTSCRVRTVPS